MLLNIIILVLVLLITAYLANQGFLSALLIFISATFAAILAGGLFESLQGLVGGYKPDYARGVTFLLLFFLGLSICRLTSDFAVPKNIKLPRAIDTALGGLMAIFASLVIVGSILIGVQMLPLPTEILGYDRFPGAMRMQAYQDEGENRVEKPGVLASSSSPWFAPDGFTVGILNMTLGRSMGGDQPFAATHPELLTELYGYRNVVQYGASETLPQDLLDVTAVSVTDNAEDLKKYQIVEPGKVAALVRTVVTLGAEPKISGNAGSKGDVAGNFFYVTPSEVRLVTDKNRQYFPVGYLDAGKIFVPLSLDVGQLAEDYSKDKAVDDWVFQINEDEKPAYVEVKALARKQVAEMTKGNLPVLASGEYPPHKIRQDVATVTVKVAGPDGAGLAGVTVYILRQNVHRRDVDSVVGPAYNNIPSDTSLQDGSNDWGKNVGKPGVPDTGMIYNGGRLGKQIKQEAPDDDVFWRDLIPVLLTGASKPNGAINISQLPDFWEKTIVPLFANSSLGTAIIAKGQSGADGTIALPNVPKGSFTIVAYYHSDNMFCAWATDFNIDSKMVTKDLTTSQAAFALTLQK